MNKVVAFDLDGTLIQSDLYLIPIFHEILAQMGIPAKPDEVLIHLIGGSVADNHRVLMPDRPLTEYERFNSYILEKVAHALPTKGRAYPHIAESLTQLRARGYTTVICSNGESDYVRSVLQTIGLDGLFDYIQPLVPNSNKSMLLGLIQAHFQPDGIVMVGDRHFDETAARDNGVPFIGCAYGLFPDEIAGADRVVADASQLPAAVEQLIG